MNAIYSGGIMAGCRESPHFMVYGQSGEVLRAYDAVKALDHAASLIYFDRRDDKRRIATLERGDQIRIVYGFSAVGITSLTRLAKGSRRMIRDLIAFALTLAVIALCVIV